MVPARVIPRLMLVVLACWLALALALVQATSSNIMCTMQRGWESWNRHVVNLQEQ